ncbi:hypothetical protein CCP2SC5_250041 [Azospirillaceae bacterium]
MGRVDLRCGFSWNPILRSDRSSQDRMTVHVSTLAQELPFRRCSVRLS